MSLLKSLKHFLVQRVKGIEKSADINIASRKQAPCLALLYVYFSFPDLKWYIEQFTSIQFVFLKSEAIV